MNERTIHAVAWEDGALSLLDQRRLPEAETRLRLDEVDEVIAAIREMVVRGAPAIGIAAAYGAVLAARAAWADHGDGWKGPWEADLERLAAARPTAVNLMWAVRRMRHLGIDLPDGQDPEPALLDEARAIHAEDLAANLRMGELGAALIEGPCGVLTHCNAGALATGGHGTALGVIRSAWKAGKIERVYADETRPWLQGARLTAWELLHDGIPVTLLADGAAAWLMKQGRVGWVIVGADRIAANGDVANKIGTYALALAARRHGVRFMVVAPTATIDLSLAGGDDIPIETRPASEVLELGGRRVAAEGAQAWNPAFDVTPAELIDAIVTERGVLVHPAHECLADLLKD